MKKLLLAMIVTTFIIGIGGCTKNEAPPKKQLVLQLKWIYNAGFVGDLIAKEKGFWSEQGLEVEVRSGGVGVAPIKVITTGDAQIGVATGDQLLMAIEEGAPIVAIALAYTDNPLGWIVRSDSGIKSALDLKGKKVGLSFIDDSALFDAMMAKVGLDPKKDVQIVPVKFDTSPFLRGEIDAFPVYRNTQGVEISAQLKKQGVETRIIGPVEEGIVSYSNLYFTTQAFVKSHPEVVQAFVTGVIKGWSYAQDHPDEVSKIVAKYDRENNLDIIKQSVVSTNKLVKPTASDHIGKMSSEGWSLTQKILLQANQIKTAIAVDTVFAGNYVQ